MELRAAPSGAELNAAPEAAVWLLAEDRRRTRTGLTAVNSKPRAGLNDTRASDVRLAAPGADLERNTLGLAIQLDSDIRLDRNWAVNLDVKDVRTPVDQKAAGSTIGEVKVDPMLYSIGLACRY